MTDKELMQRALEWADKHGEIVFAGGGWDAVNAMNVWAKAARERLAQPEQEPKLSCGVDYADGLLTVSVVRGHADGSMEVIHCEQIAMPMAAQPEQEPANKATDAASVQALMREFIAEARNVLAHLNAIEAKLKEKNA